MLPARRPQAPSIADPGDAVEAPTQVGPDATSVEAPPQVVPAAPAVDASSEDAVALATKKARQYDLLPQQPLQPMPGASQQEAAWGWAERVKLFP